MRNEAEKFCKELNIPFSEELLPWFEKGLKMMQEHKLEIVNIDRLKSINEKYNIFRKWFNDVLEAAEKIKDDEGLLLFNYILCVMIKENANLNVLKVPDRESIETDFAPMFAFLWFTEDMANYMKERGLPFEVISDTLHGFDAEIDDYYALFGRSGMRIFVGWFMHFIRHEIFRIGRLNHEFKVFDQPVRVYRKGRDVKILIDGAFVHKKGMLFESAGQVDEDGKFYAEILCDGETVTGYPANIYGECDAEQIVLEGYEEVLKRGDEVLSVHIPAQEPFTPKLCQNSFDETKEIIKNCYPEKDIKAFFCYSWLLEKRLKEVLGKETNITKFADMFECFPVKSEAKGVYGFLFSVSSDTPNEKLPENTSMQRAVKKYLLDGGYIYEKAGVILF